MKAATRMATSEAGTQTIRIVPSSTPAPPKRSWEMMAAVAAETEARNAQRGRNDSQTQRTLGPNLIGLGYLADDGQQRIAGVGRTRHQAKKAKVQSGP